MIKFLHTLKWNNLTSFLENVRQIVQMIEKLRSIEFLQTDQFFACKKGTFSQIQLHTYICMFLKVFCEDCA